MKVITRFPPSPTGNFHIGSARTALFNYLYAKRHGGKMLFRFEDTDKERSKEGFEKDITNGLDWLGLKYEFAGRQSERGEVYKKALESLLEAGKVFEGEISKDTNEKVIRFKNPNTSITFADEVRGEITFDTSDLGDFVIAKGINHPLYHLAVVVDDLEMGVTHVIRGEDHISNTPRQILIIEALGGQRPTYGHIPLILAPDRSKMSKRHGATSISEYKKMGYLPEAIVNYLALLGWNPGDEREIFSMEELIGEFSLERVQKGGAIFNIEKLNDINRHYIKELSGEEFMEKILQDIPEEIKNLSAFSKEKLGNIIPFLKERVSNQEEARNELRELSFFFEKPSYDASKLSWKDTHTDKTKEHLNAIINIVDGINENEFDEMSIKDAVWPYADKEGRGEVLWPMRFALSGKERSPDPFQIAGKLGKEETLQRLRYALEKV